MSTIADIITKTRWRIADSADLAYSEDQIISAINDGLTDLSETGFFQHSQDIAVAAYFLAFTSLTYKPRKILRIDFAGTQLSHSRIGEIKPATVLSSWITWGHLIRFNALCSGKITVYYTAYPPTYTASATVLDSRIEPFISPLAAFAEARLRLADNDGEAYDKAMSEYLTFKVNLAKTIEEQLVNGGFAQ